MIFHFHHTRSPNSALPFENERCFVVASAGYNTSYVCEACTHELHAYTMKCSSLCDSQGILRSKYLELPKFSSSYFVMNATVWRCRASVADVTFPSLQRQRKELTYPNYNIYPYPSSLSSRLILSTWWTPLTFTISILLQFPNSLTHMVLVTNCLLCRAILLPSSSSYAFLENYKLKLMRKEFKTDMQ
jgi:hypothetical protein